MKTPGWWQRRGALSHLCFPLSQLYAAGAALDRRLATPKRAPLPTIAIGNVTAGGAGKTPTAIALAQLLQQAGHTPHFISRGYKGSAQQLQQVTATDDWRVVGDEPLLLAHTAPTWVSRDRLAAANAAAQNGASLAIADDALQHHTLAADVNLLVLDGAYGIGNGQLLPAGPLRESLASALQRCHAVMMIGGDAHQLAAHINLPIFHARLQPAIDTAFLRAGNWLAFAGLGRPQKFYDLLRTLGAHLVATEDFADHHPYHTADIKKLAAKAKALNAQLITTEKDAVKIPASHRALLHILPIKLHFAEPKALLDHVTPLIFPPSHPK